jgi:hypothetical protein
VCGVEWPVFRQMIEKYRMWLVEQYGGIDKINERLVFSHNDVSSQNVSHVDIMADHLDTDAIWKHSPNGP